MGTEVRQQAEPSVEEAAAAAQLQEGASGATGEAVAKASQASGDADAAATRRMFSNLGLLAALGALGSAWVLWYTDWFPLLSGVLGLGGLFAWAAFLGGLLSKDRKESLQTAFERHVLTSRFISTVVPALFGVMLLWASAHGSVVFESKEGSGRLVALASKDSEGEAQGEHEYLAPYGQRKWVVWTGWLGRPYVVKAAGLPSALVTVGPLPPRRVTVPDQLAGRIVLLVYLEPALGAAVRRDGASFVVRRDGKEPTTIGPCDFHGGSVWVGCDAEVEIPEKVVDHWRCQLPDLFKTVPGADPAATLRYQNEWLSRLRQPAATGNLDFEPLDKVQVAVVFPNGDSYSEDGQPRLSFDKDGRKVRLIYLHFPSAGPMAGGECS
jgi:hypothetical protein